MIAAPGPLFRRGLSLAALGLLAACAKIEPPPGGPPDVTPPLLLATVPDSLRSLPRFDGEVEFRFDEVISEGSTPSTGFGTGDLEKLILLSPTTRVPSVRWRRSRLTVKPAEGWRPNTVYRVELLPGLQDLRRNRSDSGAVVTFTTGAPLPTTTLVGRLFDWTTARPVVRGLVSAVLLPDSLPYRTLTDSAGRFRLGPLPSASYLVYGVVDQNRNAQQDGREAYDTVRIGAADSLVAELWAFPRDTVGPRLTGATVMDSLSSVLAFNHYLDPGQTLTAADVTVRQLPDSTPVTAVSLLRRPDHDSVYARPPRDSAAADSAAIRPPVEAKPGPAAEVLSRRPLTDRLIVRVDQAWLPGTNYLITVRGIRNANGRSADGSTVLAVPERPKPTAADSAAAPADSTAPRPADPLQPPPSP